MKLVLPWVGGIVIGVVIGAGIVFGVGVAGEDGDSSSAAFGPTPTPCQNFASASAMLAGTDAAVAVLFDTTENESALQVKHLYDKCYEYAR